MKQRFGVIKIGSACLFDGDSLNYETLRKRAQDIKLIDLKHGIKLIPVISGAIALGKAYKKEERSTKDLNMRELQMYACLGQPMLMDFYREVFKGIYDVSQFLVTYDDLKEEGMMRRRVNDDALENILTLMNTNDGTWRRELKRDNDVPSAKLARAIYAELLLHIGVYDGMVDSNGKLILHVDKFSNALYHLCNGISDKGTGGFKPKVNAYKQVVKSKIPMIISNVKYGLIDIIEGKVPRTLFTSGQNYPSLQKDF